MSSFNWPASGSGGVPIYATLSAFPSGITPGDLAVAEDTQILYVWTGSAWAAINPTSSGTVTSVGLQVPSLSIFTAGAPVTVSGNLTLGISADSSSIPYVNGAGNNLLSGATLTANELIYFNGGTGPSSLSNGSQYQSLVANASGLPSFQAINLAQLAAVTGVLPNANTSASSANTGSAIMARASDGSFAAGNATLSAVILAGSTSGTLTLIPNATTTNYSLTFPAAQGSSGQTFSNNGSGVLSWVTAGAGTVTSVGAAGPTGIATWSSAITGSGVLTQTLSSQSANTLLCAPSGSSGTPLFRILANLDFPSSLSPSITGLNLSGLTASQLVATDSSKNLVSQAKGNLTDSSSGADGITVTGGTGAVIGSGTSIAQQVATNSQPGYLSASDHTTFSANSGTVTSFGFTNQDNLTGTVSTATTTPTLAIAPTGFAPVASSFCAWDANKNLNANSFVPPITGITTAAGTTTLLVGSTQLIYFSGTTTQICIMPVTSTLQLGQSWTIFNESTGAVTVKSSGGTTIVAMATKTRLDLTCISLTLATNLAWQYTYIGSSTPVVALSGVNSAGYDSKGQLAAQNFLNGSESITVPYSMTSDDPGLIIVTGSGGDILNMPDPTTVPLGIEYQIQNHASSFISIKDNTGAVLIGNVLPANGALVSLYDSTHWQFSLLPKFNAGSGVPNTGLIRGATGQGVVDALIIDGAITGSGNYVTLSNNSSQTIPYAMILPAANASGVFTNDGSGNLSWAAAGGTGTVTTVSVVSANGLAGTVANATTAPAITLTTSITGILSGNGTAISAASTTGSGSVVLATSPTLISPALGTPTALVGTNITGTAASFTAGGNLTLASPVSHGILLSGTANATSALSVGATSTVLVGNTGANPSFSSSPTLSGLNLTGLTASQLVSTDASKNLISQATGNLTEATSSVLTLTNGTGCVIGSGTTIQVKLASTSQSGYISNTDWNTFNGKANNILNNLGTTAINASLIPSSAATINIGSSSADFNLGYFENLVLAVGNGQLLVGGGSSASLSSVAYGTAATAGTVILRTGGGNALSRNFIDDYATTIANGGSQTMTSGSPATQYFTGSGNYTISLGSVTSSMVLGQSFTFVNLSTGSITVQSSGGFGNNIQVMASNTQLITTCIALTGTGPSAWNAAYSVTNNSTIVSGTVSSVGLSLPSMFTVSNSPVTSTGTLTAVFASQSANLFLASPAGSTGAPTLRAIVNSDFASSLSPSITGLNLSGLTASQVVVTDGSKNLASLAYATGPTASTLAQRDSSGNLTAAQLTGTKLNINGSTSGTFALLPAATTASYTLTLPASVGSTGQVLQTTNGTGTLAWATPTTVQCTGSAGSPTTITASGGITSASVAFQIFITQSAGGAVPITANPQISAGTTGYILWVTGTSASNYIQLSDGNGLSLNGTWYGTNNAGLQLLYNGSVWYELSRR